MIKKILVGIGGTPFTDVAVQRAVELGCAHEAELTGVTVVDVDRLSHVGPVPLGGGAYAQKMAQRRIEETKEKVEIAVANFEEACLKACGGCTVKRETGDTFDTMIAYARYHDLTIFGLRSLFDYSLAPEPNDALVRLVSGGVRPILAVSPRFRKVRRAMVAYSGSMESAKAMRRFVQMHLWPDVSIDIVHFSTDEAKGNELLQDAADYCRTHGYTVQTKLMQEDPKTGILSYAQQSEADIIIMGNSIRSLMFRKIMGDTVLYVIQHADRPLFLAQ